MFDAPQIKLDVEEYLKGLPRAPCNEQDAHSRHVYYEYVDDDKIDVLCPGVERSCETNMDFSS